MRQSAGKIQKAIAVIFTIQLIAFASYSQDAEVSPDTLLELSFHHIVFDMTDSVAEVTEMLVFHNKSDRPYLEDDGLDIPLAHGFSDLRLSGSQDDWELDGIHGGIRYIATLPRGMTRLVLNYNLIADNGLVKFTEHVIHPTRKFVFVTSKEDIDLQSDVLDRRESIKSGEMEVKGLSAEELSPGMTVTVLARMAGARDSRGRPGVPLVLALMSVLFLLVYGAARKARTALTGEARLERLESEKASILKAIEECPEDQRRALADRLAAKQRLIDLLLETTGRGTEG